MKPVTVATLDLHITFLHREISSLRGNNAPWATRKADQLAKISEILREMRQDKMMTGMDGKPIDAPKPMPPAVVELLKGMREDVDLKGYYEIPAQQLVPLVEYLEGLPK